MSTRSATTDPTTDQASTASAAALAWLAADGVGKIAFLHCHEGASLSIQLKNTGANSVTYVIYGTNQQRLPITIADYDIVVASATIAAAASVFYKVAAPPYLYYLVTIVDTAGGSHGAVRGDAAMKDSY